MRYNTLWRNGRQLYLEFGGKINSTVWNTYNANAYRLLTSGYFPEFGQYLENMPTHSFVDVTSGGRLSYKGKSVFSRPHYFVTFEVGMKQFVSRNKYFHIGVFADCGIVSITENSENTSKPLIVNDPHANTLPNFKYVGVLQTDIIKGNKIFMILTGVRARFSFGI
jgi:hypothetical protein